MPIVTIRDVATRAGVSTSTVSRVLNNRADVGAQTREKVMDVVRTYNYTQNANARNLKQRSVEFVAVVVRGRMNFFLTQIAEKILEYGKSLPFQFILEFIDEKADEFMAALRLRAERRLVSIIFLGSNTIGRETEIRQLSVPCIFSTVEADALPGISSVSVNNRAYARLAVEMLFDLGHRHIALIGYQSQGVSRDSIGLRYAGVMDAYAARGIPIDETLFAHSDFALSSAYRATTTLIKQNANFTAVFALSDTVALGAIKALGDAGRKVPEDVSVVGFDGLEIAQYLQPPLTTIRQPTDLIAEKSVALMMRALKDGEFEQIFVEAEVLGGGTVKKIGPSIDASTTGQVSGEIETTA